MAKKPSITTVASGYQSTTTINDNTQNLRNAFDNTLSLDGSTPNAMQADLDMNSNDIINASRVYTDGLYINNQPVSPGIIDYNGVIKETKIATAGQTVFNLVDITYTPNINNLSVFVNGVYKNTTYYTENSSSQVTFFTGLTAGQVVDFVVLSVDTLSGTADAVNITYTSTGSGAVTTTVSNKLKQTVSVKDFGATGDGVTDDTVAVHAAITYAKSKRGSVFFPTGTYRVTSGYTDSVDYQDVRLYGEGSTREATNLNTNPQTGSHIRLDSTDPASFFYRVNSRTHLQIENLTFSCAQYVQDRTFIAFNALANSFTLENLNFESVEKPICFEVYCYFQSSSMINVQFRSSGTIHSVGGITPGPGGIDLRGTLLILIDVHHEGFVPINTDKIVCDLSSVRQITADNLLLEGALPASGWTVLKLSNPYDANYTRANFALFRNFHSEWGGPAATYTVDQIGGNVQWDLISGIDPAFPYRLSNLGSVDISSMTFSGTTADAATYFSLENSQCVVRLTNCAARNFDTSNTSILYRMVQIASPDNGFGQVVIDATDSSSAYKWSGGYVLADNVTSTFIGAGQAMYPSTDATYGRKLVLAPDGSGILNPSITIPAVIKAGMQVTIMARMKLPTFASGLWAALGCNIGTLSPIAYKTIADSGAIVDVQVTVVAIADLTAISFGSSSGTTPGATGGTVVEIYALEVFVGSQIPRRLFSDIPKRITTSNTAAPTVGSWAVGDRVFNSAPAIGQPKSWVCTVAGTPGTWVSEGNL